MVADIWHHRRLLGQLIKRDVLLRYRGAVFGALWMFLSPLFMLVIFAFVFGQVFQSRWPQQGNGLPFWVLLYSGLITFNIFGETISRASTSVRAYPSFVKKIIFPVHILPLVPLGAALVHGAFNFFLLLLALGWIGAVRGDLVIFPFLVLPVVLLALGLAWFLAAWGVFIKDMTQIVPILVQALLFGSPVFYPSSAVPEVLQSLYRYNPLGPAIESSRALVAGQPIQWGVWAMSLLFCAVVFVLGYAFFQDSREEFADAL
jgi:lipopolysaccharide transport system permease protein